MDPCEILTSKEAARIAGVKPDAVRRAYERGKLEGKIVRGVLLTTRAAVARWREERYKRA